MNGRPGTHTSEGVKKAEQLSKIVNYPICTTYHPVREGRGTTLSDDSYYKNHLQALVIHRAAQDEFLQSVTQTIQYGS